MTIELDDIDEEEREALRNARPTFRVSTQVNCACGRSFWFRIPWHNPRPLPWWRRLLKWLARV